MILLLLAWFALAQEVKTEVPSSVEPKNRISENTDKKTSTKRPPPLPKYELGFGYLYGRLPDYPGANETTLRSFPIPYFVYRGDVVQASGPVKVDDTKTQQYAVEEMKSEISRIAGRVEDIEKEPAPAD